MPVVHVVLLGLVAFSELCTAASSSEESLKAPVHVELVVRDRRESLRDSDVRLAALRKDLDLIMGGVNAVGVTAVFGTKPNFWAMLCAWEESSGTSAFCLRRTCALLCRCCCCAATAQRPVAREDCWATQRREGACVGPEFVCVSCIAHCCVMDDISDFLTH